MQERQSPDSGSAITAAFPDLEGKVAIVTGASRGIGRGIAGFLGRQGMRLTLAARSTEQGQAVAADLQSADVDCQWVTADLSGTEGARKVLDATLERYGAANLLVNNAAMLGSRDFLHLDGDTYRRSFELNVRIVYELSLLLARHMADAGRGGCIVNISSVGGLRAHRDMAGYDAAKGAIDALTRSMALDLAPDGIRVNAVAPGATSRNEPGEADSARHNTDRRREEGVPLGRFAWPEEIGAAVAFLASDAAAYITGQILYVDGGLTAQLTPPGIFI